MRNLLFCVLITCISCTVYASTINLDWVVGDTTYTQTTCESGGDLILPSSPTKYGYTFMGWSTTAFAQLEYIESTGTQYIDTGIREAKFVHDIAFTERNNTNLMGFSAMAGGYWGQHRTGNDGYEFSNSTIYTDSSVRNTVVYNSLNDPSVLSANNQTISWTRPATSNNYCLLHVCTGYANSYYAKARLWGVKVYDANDSLIQDFVPARRNIDNKIGMYDTITKTFFENSGTGEFIAGPLVGPIQE